MQVKLDTQIRRLGKSNGGRASSPLTGRIFAGEGEPTTPTFAYGRSGRLYRYYVAATLQQGGAGNARGTSPRRVSSASLEAYLSARLTALVPNQLHQPLDLVSKVEIHANQVVLFLPVKLMRSVEMRLGFGETCTPDPADPTKLCLVLPFRFSTQRGKTEIVGGVKTGSSPYPALIAALRAAHALTKVGSSASCPTATAAPASSYNRRLIRLAFLAPDIQDAILAGQQPTDLNLADLMDIRLPTLWSEQRNALGWPPTA